MLIAAWTFIKSKFAGWIAVAAVVVGVLFGAYRAGQKSSTADRATDTLREVKQKAEIDAEVSRMSAAARRDELRKWADK